MWIRRLLWKIQGIDSFTLVYTSLEADCYFSRFGNHRSTKSSWVLRGPEVLFMSRMPEESCLREYPQFRGRKFGIDFEAKLRLTEKFKLEFEDCTIQSLCGISQSYIRCCATVFYALNCTAELSYMTRIAAADDACGT